MKAETKKTGYEPFEANPAELREEREEMRDEQYDAIDTMDKALDDMLYPPEVRKYLGWED